jgi:hypothetical protein
MPFRTAFLSILGVLALHAILILTGAYFTLGWLDAPMHFLGGFSMGLFGLAIHHAVASRRHTHTVPLWYHFLFVAGFAMLVGVAWEFYEYVFDNTFAVWYGWPISQLSLEDTMGDFVMDFLGASAAFFAFRARL